MRNYFTFSFECLSLLQPRPLDERAILFGSASSGVRTKMHPVRYPCNAAPPPRSPTPNPQGTESLGDDLYVHIRVICFYLLWETSFVTAWKLSSHPISLLYQDFVKAAVWLYCYFVSITIPLSLDSLFSGVQKLFAFSDSRTTPAPLWLSSHILLPRCWRRRRRAGDCGWRQSATWRGVTTSLSTLSCATHERSRISMSYTASNFIPVHVWI